MYGKNRISSRVLAVLGLVLLPLLLSAAVDLDFFGYYENRFFLLNDGEVSWDDFKEKFKLGDYNRLRLQLQASPSKKVTVNVAVDFFTFHGALRSPLGTVDTGGGAQKDEVLIDLDRAYVDLYFKHFDISVGKQRVAMGVSYLWAPLDVFNRVNFMEPKEEKPGVNAVKLYLPLGSSSSITAVFSPDEDFETSKSGLRAQTQLFGVDMAATLIRSGDTETSIYGVDLRGENFIGWWVEAAHVDAPEDSYQKLVLGFDYTFPLGRGLYWLSEFFYDTGGEKNRALYDYQKVLTGERFTLGRTYFFSMLRYSFSDFLSGSVSYIGNWGDGSYVLNPGLQYEISQSVSVSSGCYFPMGKTGGELKRKEQSVFYIWLKVNF